jgi:hypothetical protein
MLTVGGAAGQEAQRRTARRPDCAAQNTSRASHTLAAATPRARGPRPRTGRPRCSSTPPCARTRTWSCACAHVRRATSRALGDAAAAAASGRLSLTLGCEGSASRSEVAFVERRGALLRKLRVVDGAWADEDEFSDYMNYAIERVLAPALLRAAAAGRLAGLRVVELPSFELEGGLLRALALCPALTRGTSAAALRGLRELRLCYGCGRAAAPALAGLSALTRLTRLRLELTGAQDTSVRGNTVRIKLSHEWSALHVLPVSLLDLSLEARFMVRRGAGPQVAAHCQRQLAAGDRAPQSPIPRVPRQWGLTWWGAVAGCERRACPPRLHPRAGSGHEAHATPPPPRIERAPTILPRRAAARLRPRT